MQTLKRFRSRAADSFLSDVRGGVAIEFAILIPILITMLFGIIQYGNILYVRQLMTQAAAEAARSYAYDSTTAADAEQLADDRLVATGLTYAITLTEPGTDETNVKVLITTPMNEAALVNVLGSVISGNIEVSVVLRMESAECVTSSTTSTGSASDTELSTDCTIISSTTATE